MHLLEAAGARQQTTTGCLGPVSCLQSPGSQQQRM